MEKSRSVVEKSFDEMGERTERMPSIGGKERLGCTYSDSEKVTSDGALPLAGVCCDDTLQVSAWN